MAWNNNVKIEGKSFNRIRDLLVAKKAAQDEANRIYKEAHEALWNVIHEEFPQLDRTARLSLDVEYEKLGFYVVKESEGAAGLLAALKGTLG